MSGSFGRELSQFVVYDKGRRSGEEECRCDANFGDAGIEQVFESRRECRRRDVDDDALRSTWKQSDR